MLNMSTLQAREPEGDLRNKGNRKQRQEHCNKKGHHRNTESFYGNISDTAADKKVDTNGRSQKPHG